jgi:hypothetical protein
VTIHTRACSRTSRPHIQQHLQSFHFKALFVEELGWEILKEPPLVITIDDRAYILRPLVEKRGVKVLVCDPDVSGQIPADRLLRKIEREVTRLAAYEQFIIYIDTAREHQVWQWVKREQGKRAAVRINRYHRGQSGELLTQKLEQLAVRLEEEEHLHMVDVVGRVAQAFDVERVTKKFYDRFKLEHTAFLQLIEGVQEQAEREWYASLMLNRLMFVYFIQRKGFLDTREPDQLDGDPHYLSNRLKRVQKEYTTDHHTFYRSFLLKLFHSGLGQRHHSPELIALLGNIPYLNGGLFDIHVLEQSNPEITIPDEAFSRLFAFFDEFDWHLDNRPLHNDREINPDVLGYIFEKYTNQKQMGAYYTREDITEYISTSTILPFILDAAEQRCPAAFSANGPVWMLLRENPDAYIHDAVKKGCEVPLPPEIEAGVQNMAQRGEWNRPAPETYALPTETWREVVTRRTHYQEVRARLIARQITSINELIASNLDIRHFTEDVITYCTSADVLRALYESITQVRVLDPTCGSGAFLFAALNILEGLYAACLERMQDLLEEHASLDATLQEEKPCNQADLLHFHAVLEQVGRHPHRAYFIYMSIIVNNLYGVDIMKEATETCKLRFFLKLASQVETFDDIKPLPDIDFNIRAGNTLVGFASYKETQQALAGHVVGKGRVQSEIAIQKQMVFDSRLERIEQQAREVEQTFEHFRQMQTQPVLDSADLAASKQHLQAKLGKLRTELDSYLAADYGIERDDIPTQAAYKASVGQWHQQHQPFHWWVEFYGIMSRGGFDVIIGNPPYVEYSKVKHLYQVQFYQTSACNNLYAYTMERSLGLLRQHGRFGMIVPVSAVSGESYQALNRLLLPYTLWISTYSNRPGKLFAGVEQRLTVLLAQIAARQTVWAAPYQHWYEIERERLFSTLVYCHASRWEQTGMPIKSGHRVVEQIFSRLCQHKALHWMLPQQSNTTGVWVHDGPTYWVRAFPFEPNLGMKSSHSNHYHKIPTRTSEEATLLAALLSSSTFYLFYKMISNCRDLGPKEWLHMPFARPQAEIETLLIQSGKALARRLHATASKRTRQYASGPVVYEEYYPARARAILDDIDRILAQHYGFTDQELDFILNYDIKYRMGREKSSEAEG